MWVGIEGKVQHRNRDVEKMDKHMSSKLAISGKTTSNHPTRIITFQHLSRLGSFSVSTKPLLHNNPDHLTLQRYGKNHGGLFGHLFQFREVFTNFISHLNHQGLHRPLLQTLRFEAAEISNRSIYMQWFGMKFIPIFAKVFIEQLVLKTYICLHSSQVNSQYCERIFLHCAIEQSTGMSYSSIYAASKSFIL